MISKIFERRRYDNEKCLDSKKVKLVLVDNYGTYEITGSGSTLNDQHQFFKIVFGEKNRKSLFIRINKASKFFEIAKYINECGTEYTDDDTLKEYERLAEVVASTLFYEIFDC